MRIGARRSRGFTLLEVVLAIALFAFLMSVLYAGLATSVRAYDAAQLRTDAGSRLRVVSAFLRRSLEGAQPLALVSRNEWKLIFEGEPERVRYVADLPGYLGFGGLHEIVIEQRSRDTEESRLVMRRRPVSIGPDSEPRGEFDERVLLERSGELALRYFGSDDDRTAPTWRESWPASQRMPLLVELALREPDGSEWPTLLVALRVDTVRYLGTGTRGTARTPRTGAAASSASSASGAPAPPGTTEALR